MSEWMRLGIESSSAAYTNSTMMILVLTAWYLGWEVTYRTIKNWARKKRIPAAEVRSARR